MPGVVPTEPDHSGVLDISSRQLKELPASLRYYSLSSSAVRELNVSFNALTSLLGVVESCPHVCRISAAHNQLRSLPDLRSLGSLCRLDLSHNRLADVSALSGAPALAELWLSHNELPLSALLPLCSLPVLRDLVTLANPCERVNPVGLAKHATVLLLPNLCSLNANPIGPHTRSAAYELFSSQGAKSALSEQLGPKPALALLRGLPNGGTNPSYSTLSNPYGGVPSTAQGRLSTASSRPPPTGASNASRRPGALGREDQLHRRHAAAGGGGGGYGGGYGGGGGGGRGGGGKRSQPNLLRVRDPHQPNLLRVPSGSSIGTASGISPSSASPHGFGAPSPGGGGFGGSGSMDGGTRGGMQGGGSSFGHSDGGAQRGVASVREEEEEDFDPMRAPDDGGFEVGRVHASHPSHAPMDGTAYSGCDPSRADAHAQRLEWYPVQQSGAEEQSPSPSGASSWQPPPPATGSSCVSSTCSPSSVSHGSLRGRGRPRPRRQPQFPAAAHGSGESELERARGLLQASEAALAQAQAGSAPKPTKVGPSAARYGRRSSGRSTSSGRDDDDEGNPAHSPRRGEGSQPRRRPEPSTTVPSSESEFCLHYPHRRGGSGGGGGGGGVAVTVRSDGSAVARWPGGKVGVTVDLEGGGSYRLTAHYRRGNLAVAFDASGAGFAYRADGSMALRHDPAKGGALLSPRGDTLQSWPAGGSGELPGGRACVVLDDTLAVLLRLPAGGASVAFRCGEVSHELSRGRNEQQPCWSVDEPKLEMLGQKKAARRAPKPTPLPGGAGAAGGLVGIADALAMLPNLGPPPSRVLALSNAHGHPMQPMQTPPSSAYYGEAALDHEDRW